MFINDKSAHSKALLHPVENKDNTRQITNAPSAASMMSTTRQLLKEGKRLPLSVLLYSTHPFKATEPRDKIFALLGISDPATWGPIHIDYTKDISTLYRRHSPLHSI